MTELDRLEAQAEEQNRKLRDLSSARNLLKNAHDRFEAACPAESGMLGMFEVMVAAIDSYQKGAEASALFANRLADEEAQAIHAAE